MGLESRHVFSIILTTLYCMTGICTYVQRLYTLHNCLILCQPLSSLHRRFQKYRIFGARTTFIFSTVLSTLSSATRISRDWVLITQIHPKSPTWGGFWQKMAASLEKDKSEEKKDKGFLEQLAVRYKYCVLKHPILTKSVTRQEKVQQTWKHKKSNAAWFADVNQWSASVNTQASSAAGTDYYSN